MSGSRSTCGEKDKIFQAINKVLKDKNYKKYFSKFKALYGQGKTAENILKVIKNLKIDKKLFEKKMTY